MLAGKKEINIQDLDPEKLRQENEEELHILDLEVEKAEQERLLKQVEIKKKLNNQDLESEKKKQYEKSLNILDLEVEKAEHKRWLKKRKHLIFGEFILDKAFEYYTDEIKKINEKRIKEYEKEIKCITNYRDNILSEMHQKYLKRKSDYEGMYTTASHLIEMSKNEISEIENKIN